eukprot:270733_1
MTPQHQYIIFTSILIISLFKPHESTEWISILGDPQLRFAPNGPRIMIEAWNFCNRAGPSFPGDPPLPSPRYADCVNTKANNCTYGSNNNNCITPQLNNAQTKNPSNGTEEDFFTINKEANLGSKCQIDNTYFWTAMLKSGNYISSSKLCGPPYPPSPPSSQHITFNELPMNQPIVLHNYTNSKSHGLFEGTWDINSSRSLINVNSNISYFKLEWMYKTETETPVLRNTIKTSKYYPWLMLYTGLDVGYGEKGGVQYIGRGMMKYAPSTDTDFIVQYNLSVNTAFQAESSSSFYFLNMGACWKNNNNGLKDVQCDGNTTTDVTRYILMETNPDYHVSCSKSNPMRCPRYHTFINGTVVSRNDTDSYPYDAYKEWCTPWGCDDLLPGEPVCDRESNPMQQNFMKLAPHPEWAYHGFPSSSGEGYVNSSQTFWALHVGDLLNRLYFSCTDKGLVTNWTTFNIGPEAGIGTWQGHYVLYQWDISDFDVLVPK